MTVPIGVMFLAVVRLTLASPALAGQELPPPPVDTFSAHPRVVIISDIGNEPDDQMSFLRLLLYSNEHDLEAMIASTSIWQRAATHPETIRKLVDACGQVRTSLPLHATGWPAAEDLAARVFAGQPAYGLAATGARKVPRGSLALAKAIEWDDPRPLLEPAPFGATAWRRKTKGSDALRPASSTR